MPNGALPDFASSALYLEYLIGADATGSVMSAFISTTNTLVVPTIGANFLAIFLRSEFLTVLTSAAIAPCKSLALSASNTVSSIVSCNAI